MISNNNIIPFVFDNWHENYQWWIPNTVPADFIINGEKHLPATHDFAWFDYDRNNINAKPWFNVSFDYPAYKNDYLYEHNFIKYVKKSDITNEKYIYPVMIRVYGYFDKHKDVGFKYVSNEVIKDVKNNKAKIVLMYPFEGICGSSPSKKTAPNTKNDFSILNKWCTEAGLNKDQVYFIHGNWKITSELLSYNFTYVPVLGFYNRLKTDLTSITEFNPINDRNLFLCYNRRVDWGRQLLLCEMLKNGLLNKGCVSYISRFPNDAVQAVQEHNRTDLLDAATTLESISPLTLDVVNLDRTNPVDFINVGHHSTTFLSLITETLWGEDTIFFTEKTLKPILAGQPFLLFSSPGSLKELQRQGYQTFSKWWDESYDAELNLDKRVSIIVSVLKKINELSIQDLKSIRKNMSEILIYNQNLYKSRKSFCEINGYDYFQFLYVEIKKIWDKC